MKEKLKVMDKEMAKLRQTLENKDSEAQKLKKEVEIYKKKVEDLDKAGGRIKMNRL